MPIAETYLDACLKDGLTVRWPESAMPIAVYVAPFRWYEKKKQQESYAYNQMVYDAFDAWQELSEERVRFRYVANLNLSQLDVSWRRVDRTSLGHCEYMVNKQSLIYSAEIKIGISDGLVHAQYNDPEEVRHTILHEVGHAIGLTGHSDAPGDIMYVPHQYGVTALSERDVRTLRTLYDLPTAFDYEAIGRKHKLREPFTFHNVMDVLHGRLSTLPDDEQGKTLDFLPALPPEDPATLANHHDILSQMGRFHLATQSPRLNPTVKQLYTQPVNPSDPLPVNPSESLPFRPKSTKPGTDKPTLGTPTLGKSANQSPTNPAIIKPASSHHPTKPGSSPSPFAAPPLDNLPTSLPPRIFSRPRPPKKP